MKSTPVFRLDPVKSDHVTLWPICCLHIGHHRHEMQKTVALLDKILRDRNSYVIMLGDTVDVGTRSSPGASVYEQDMNASEQVLVAGALLTPLVEAGKILFWLDSNHSRRLFTEAGTFTAEEQLARMFFGAGFSGKDKRLLNKYVAGGFDGTKKLKEVEGYLQEVISKLKPGVSQVFWGGLQALSRIQVGPNRYKLHAFHGSGGGATHKTVISQLDRMEKVAPGNDIYVSGHHHKRLVFDADKIVLDHRGDVQYRPAMYVSTGCMLGYDGSYGEAKGYVPTRPGMTRIKLYANNWGVEACV